MSKCIMIQKNYKMWECGSVVAEQQRRLKTYKNDVDLSKSKYNLHLYGLFNSSQNSLPDFIKDYKKKYNIGGRFNVDKEKHLKNGTNVVCQTLFTASSDFFENMDRDEILNYLYECYYFFKAKYADCPIISADIHFDESNPHLHISWMPIFEDKETHKLSFNQKKLQSGKDYFKYLQLEFYNNMVSCGYDFDKFDDSIDYLPLDDYKKKIEVEKKLFTADPVQKIEYREQILNKNAVSASRESILTANEQLQRLEVLENENNVLRFENEQLQRECSRLRTVQERYYKLLLKFKQLENELKGVYNYLKALDIPFPFIDKSNQIDKKQSFER